MSSQELKINVQSIRNELKSYSDKPFDCLFEYIWNSFDANATEVKLDFIKPLEGIGSVNDVTLIDNGDGWNFDDNATTNNFMSSMKNPIPNKTLPKGQYGRGRYAFIWVADKLVVYSKNKKLTLQSSTDIIKEDADYNDIGTKICFENIKGTFSDALLSEKLFEQIAIEFAWFLQENSRYKIIINGVELNANDYVKDSKEYHIDSLPDNVAKNIVGEFYAKIVIWKFKPSEYSKYYYLNASNTEIAKQNTGLNKKSDNFWHSVYIKSPIFGDINDIEVDDKNEKQYRMSFTDDKTKRVIRQIKDFLKSELIKIRKPLVHDKNLKRSAICL